MPIIIIIIIAIGNDDDDDGHARQKQGSGRLSEDFCPRLGLRGRRRRRRRAPEVVAAFEPEARPGGRAWARRGPEIFHC